MKIQPLSQRHLRDAARLHRAGLPDDFITRFGERFLAEYYRAFIHSPHAVALAVVDDRGGRDELCGVLIGTLANEAHYAYLIRYNGLRLAMPATVRMLSNPVFAFEVLQTRLIRYFVGISRNVRRTAPGERLAERPDERLDARAGDAPAGEAASLAGGWEERVGLLSHIVVSESYRGFGFGSDLVAAYEMVTREAGLDRIELATHPGDAGAGKFYLMRGWTFKGEATSRSGERFDIYTRSLRDSPTAAAG